MSRRKTYQPILNGRPFGSPVIGYRAALSKRRAVVCGACSERRFTRLNIVDTPGVSMCYSCIRHCSCRLREVSRG